jgi:hypothetical protein
MSQNLSLSNVFILAMAARGATHPFLHPFSNLRTTSTFPFFFCCHR